MTKRINPKIAPPVLYDTEVCPVRAILAPISTKWAQLIMSHLSFGQHRFSELLGAIPDISQRMLTQTLRTLERNGMVERTVQASIPPRVDYALTPLGKTYLAPVLALLEWGLTYRAQVDDHQKAYDWAHEEKPPRRKTG